MQLYRALGCVVVSLSQYRPSHVTEGLPDLRVYCPRKAIAWWFETKAARGKQSPAQRQFQALAEACGDVYVLGGVGEALAHLRTIGVTR